MKRALRTVKNIVRSWFGKMPQFDVDERHKIVPAFIYKGTQYYQFEDINNMMTGRAFTCLDYYNELSMRCSREYLTKHCDAMEGILNSSKIDLVSIAQLHTQMKERLEMILDPDIVYKIASVVYFDATEQPYTYDFRYNQKKIRDWREDGVDGFFLQIPLNDLIPFLDLSQVDLKAYMTVAEKMNQNHSINISTLKSETTKSQGS